MSGKATKTVIIIAGPTGVGKTAVAIEIARHFGTEIISADSRQCYKELNIGVARPSPEELQQVPHHFIASHSIHHDVTAAVFEKYALQKAAELFTQHDIVIMAGGTGLYIKAFCEGLDNIPAIPASIRNNIIDEYNSKGLSWLQQQILQKDPLFYKEGEIQNPQRLMRALEVVEVTGQSIIHFQKGKIATRDFAIVKIGLDLPKEELYNRINERVYKMIDAGLTDEVTGLLPYKNLNALQTVGYTEVFDFLAGNIALNRSIELIQQNTRRYAKRQKTWFNRDKEINWFNPQQVAAIKEHLHTTINLPSL